jgi:NitT/TauT family transport system permease protein
MMAAPGLAYLPLLVIWFGTDLVSRICVVVIFAIFPILLNTVAGVRHVDATLVEMARSFQAPQREILLKVMVPNALPLIMAGVRIGTGRAVKGVITAEVFLTIVGLGGLIMRFGSSYRTDLLLATVATVVVFGLVVTELVKWFDRRLTRWAVGGAR